MAQATKKVLAESTEMRPQIDQTPQNVGQEAQDVPSSPRQTQQTFGDTRLKPRPEYKPFADALREAMTKGNLSASEVARRVWGITKDRRGYDVARNRDRIGHYLAGTSYPEPENLKELANAVGLTVEDLAIDRPEPAAGTRSPRQTTDMHITFLADRPDKARVQLDRVLDWGTALKIIEMIKADEQMGACGQPMAARRVVHRFDPNDDAAVAAADAVA